MNRFSIDAETRNVLNKIRHTSRSGSKVNHFYCYMSESDNHINLKFKTYLKLRREGYDLLCEPIFNSGIRFDILAWREGIFKGVEILSSETLEQLAKKTENYPEEIEILIVKNEEDIKNLDI